MTTHPTGIHRLDELLGGGLGPHARLLIRHDDRVPPHPFVYQIFAAQSAQGGEAILLPMETPAEFIEKELDSLGYRPDARARVAPDLRDARSIEDVASTLRGVIGRHRGALVVPPRLDSMAKRFGPEVVKASLDALFDAVGEAAASIWCASDSLMRSQLGAAAESAELVLRLGPREGLLQNTQEFAIERCAWRPTSQGSRHAYAVLRPGGVVLHIPKVLVTGPHDAGKSEFIRAVCGTSSSIETSGTTVALDHGQLRRDGVLVDLFGTPGQERFEPVIRRLARGALGVILVLDASRPETLARAQHIMTHTWEPTLPLVVAANRPDAPNAVPTAELRSRLGLPETVPILACQANRREPALRVVDALLEQILRAPSP